MKETVHNNFLTGFPAILSFLKSFHDDFMLQPTMQEKADAVAICDRIQTQILKRVIDIIDPPVMPNFPHKL